MHKFIINTSNLYVGGGVQVALSFIDELKYIEQNNEYHIFLSNAIDKQINRDLFSKNIYFYLIEKSPSSLKNRNNIVSILNSLEEKIKPNIVFSVFGPTYWKPKSSHLIGFADGWLYNPNSIAYKKLSFIKRIKMRLSTIYKSYYLKKDGNYFVLETEDARKKLSTVTSINKKYIFVIGNTYSSVFNSELYKNRSNDNYIELPYKEENEFRFMYIAHNHPSKNLEIINEVLPLIEEINIKFVLTIDSNSYNDLFNNSNKIINLGPISQKSCPSIYMQCDALFAPTLLETFSAAYPESMIMGVPILTSEYSFAKSICNDSALYFDPLNPIDIAEKIKLIVSSKRLQNELIKKGRQQVKTFETAHSRAEKYINLCEEIIKKEKNVQK